MANCVTASPGKLNVTTPYESLRIARRKLSKHLPMGRCLGRVLGRKFHKGLS
ncbi:hypothetical protein [Leptospira alexanderi]|uniref:hypothetical protein n=1 Tax=Leptospira alexanderi TaxID=100053 RepID=UPI0002FD7966|nr:hypothetical protein [Leptospira alexanderi]